MNIDYGQYYPVWVDEFKRCSQWIEGALEYANGSFDLKDIADGIHSGQYQLWTCETAALVTQFVKSPKATTMHLFLAGGDMAGVEYLVRDCIGWAKEANCDSITLIGRPGWSKSFLTALGFSKDSINMRMKLE